MVLVSIPFIFFIKKAFILFELVAFPTLFFMGGGIQYLHFDTHYFLLMYTNLIIFTSIVLDLILPMVIIMFIIGFIILPLYEKFRNKKSK